MCCAADECYIQFLETNKYLTVGTAIAAYYAPATVMCVLYWRVWRETENRQKDLVHLQAGKKNDSHRSNSRSVKKNRSACFFVCFFDRQTTALTADDGGRGEPVSPLRPRVPMERNDKKKSSRL